MMAQNSKNEDVFVGMTRICESFIKKMTIHIQKIFNVQQAREGTGRNLKKKKEARLRI